MPYQLEVRLAEQVRNVVLGAGEEIVYAQHVVAICNEALAEMRTQKSRATRYEDAFARAVASHSPVPGVICVRACRFERL
jgi:hypothetical protein